MGNKRKYVYLVGNDQLGYTAHAYDKKIAKGYTKQYKQYWYKKVKITTKIEQRLFEDNEIHEYDNGLYLTESEESFAFESLGQFFIDVQQSLRNLTENVHYLKLTDEERLEIKVLTKLIFNFIYRYDNDDYGTDLLNQKGMLKYFINHVMKGK